MKTIKDLPSLSIILVTRNVEDKLPYWLACIKRQDYPREKLEILAVDGGSTDATIDMLGKAKFPIKIINGKYPNDQEARRVVGLRHATGDIIAFIDSDNYLPHGNWLRKMVTPFVYNSEVVGSFTLRYGYRKHDSLLNRYFALLGSADPVDHYLGKGERLSFLYDSWNRYGTVMKKYKNYFLVKFDSQHLPTLGANGFLARSKIWKMAKVKPSEYVDVDIARHLIDMGFDTYAVVNDSIIHDTAATLISFLKKRTKYIMIYQYKIKKRKYRVFDSKRIGDVWNLFLFILFSITIIQPLIFAIRGYIKKKDLAWFIHPIYCLAVTITYSTAMSLGYIQNSLKRFKS